MSTAVLLPRGKVRPQPKRDHAKKSETRPGIYGPRVVGLNRVAFTTADFYVRFEPEGRFPSPLRDTPGGVSRRYEFR